MGASGVQQIVGADNFFHADRRVIRQVNGGDRTGEQGHGGPAGGGLFGEGLAHFAGAGVADEPDGVEVLAGGAG